jgi:hypothetical protein
MEKEFISYTEALALKELGFDEPCFGYWNIDPYLPNPTFNLVKPFDHEWCIPAPLYQQAFRWFRNNYSIFSSIDVNYFYKIYVNDEFFEESINYNSHEDSELECLKKLIEIVKLK